MMWALARKIELEYTNVSASYFFCPFLIKNKGYPDSYSKK